MKMKKNNSKFLAMFDSKYILPMKNLIILSLIFAVCFYSMPVKAQDNSNITVKVISPYKQAPVEGAIVSISNCTNENCTGKTNAQGEVTLTVSKRNGDISVWAPDFYSNTTPLSGRSSVTILLVPVNKINYNDQIRAPFTGAYNQNKKQTNAYTIQKNNISISKSIADETFENVPGLQVIQKSGMPGEGSWFNIRGINSIVGNTTPLIVINGMVYFPDMNESPIINGYSKNILNFLSATDIESITFLKGSDAALYGSLGSNGVLLIETNKATDMETKIEFSGQYGMDYNQVQMPVMGVNDYKSYINSIAKTKYNDMSVILADDKFPYLVDDPNYYYKYLYNNNTNWQDLIYQPAFVTDNVLKVKGGDAIAKYNFSVGVLDKKGQLVNTGYSRYNVRLNADVNLHRNMSMFLDISAVNSKNDLMEQGMSLETNPMLAALRKAPLLSPYEKDVNNNESPDYAKIRNSDGVIIENNSVSNPLALVNTVDASSKSNDIQFSGGLKYTLSQYIKLTGQVGLHYNFNRDEIFVPGVTDYTTMPTEELLAQNSVKAGEGETFNMYYSINGTYSRNFNQVHDVKVSTGAQISTTDVEYDAGMGRNTASDFYKTLNYVSSTGRSITGYNNLWNWMNFFTNIQYVYDSQYALGLNVSADGSSASGINAPRYKLFPAVNAAWYAKNSAFLNNVSWVNKFTLRAEYTTTGNSRFSSMLSKYHYVTSPFRVLSGIMLASVPNTELTSETNKTIDVGFDFSVINNRVNLSVDYYNSKVSDMIIPKKVSSAFGNDYFYSNDATVSNKGFEVGLQLDVIHSRNLNWQLGGTIASNTNKVEDLGGIDNLLIEMPDGSALIIEKGKPLYSFYGYKSLGVFASETDAQTANLKNYAGNSYHAGDIHFVDKEGEGSGVINQDDRFNLGDATPDYFGNIYSVIQYKKIALSVNMSYSLGNKAYNAVRRTLESSSDFANQAVTATRRWVYDGQVTDIPRATYGDPMGNSRFSDRWIEDASYLKIKEVMLSYKLNLFEGATVYVAGNNLYTFTNYLGSDPEFMYSYNPALQGFDYAKIALARTFKVGFKLQF
jgi:TonB-linked SusC/RagA family outer membrane protein